jgi:hypothetical protein
MAVAAPVWSACFDFLEVTVGVAFDVLLAIRVSVLVEMNGSLLCTCPSSVREHLQSSGKPLLREIV